MNTLRKYIQVLLETQAPADAPAGEYLFAPFRDDAPEPKEPNTDVEEKMWEILRNHIEGGQLLSKENAETLHSWAENGWYTSILKPPDDMTVYRGMKNIHFSDLQKMIKGADIDKSKLHGFVTFEPGDEFVYRNSSNQYASSWSSDKSIGEHFSGEANARGMQSYYSILMYANTSKNKFLLNPDVAGFISHDLHEEDELIGLGDIKVDKIEWYSHYEQIKWKIDKLIRGRSMLDRINIVELPEHLQSNLKEFLRKNEINDIYKADDYTYIAKLSDRSNDKMKKWVYAVEDDFVPLKWKIFNTFFDMGF